MWTHGVESQSIHRFVNDVEVTIFSLLFLFSKWYVQIQAGLTDIISLELSSRSICYCKLLWYIFRFVSNYRKIVMGLRVTGML